MCCSRRDFRRPSCPPRITPSVEHLRKNALPEKSQLPSRISFFFFVRGTIAAPRVKTESEARRTPRFPKTLSAPYSAVARVRSSTRSSFLPRSPRAAAAAVAGPSLLSSFSSENKKKVAGKKYQTTLPGKLFSDVPRGRANVNLHYANASCQTRVRSDTDVSVYTCVRVSIVHDSLSRVRSPLLSAVRCFPRKTTTSPSSLDKKKYKNRSIKKCTFSKRDLDEDLVRFCRPFSSL